jgi:hypothetical protein
MQRFKMVVTAAAIVAEVVIVTDNHRFYAEFTDKIISDKFFGTKSSELIIEVDDK